MIRIAIYVNHMFNSQYLIPYPSAMDQKTTNILDTLLHGGLFQESFSVIYKCSGLTAYICQIERRLAMLDDMFTPCSTVSHPELYSCSNSAHGVHACVLNLNYRLIKDIRNYLAAHHQLLVNEGF